MLPYGYLKEAPTRPSRSQLFVPAIKPALFEKASKSEADIITLDLEDSVSPAEKEQARRNIIENIGKIDWKNKTVCIRINATDTHFCYRDVVDLIEQTNDEIDLIMIPKVNFSADVYAIDMLISQIEMAKGKQKKIKLELIMETAMGLTRMEEIVQSSKRLEAVHFGCADYAASMGMAVTGIGGTQDHYGMLTGNKESETRNFYQNDPWHYPMVQMVALCKAYGILPIDGPFGDYSDPEGYLAQARRSHILGCVGKWAIHPNQVALANKVFTPSDELIEQAQRILDAMEEARKQGFGAVTLDGKLIDLASIRQAQGIVQQAEKLKQTS
jgi:malyl-CoA/(S)-citramalyl-CoA lyase